MNGVTVVAGSVMPADAHPSSKSMDENVFRTPVNDDWTTVRDLLSITPCATFTFASWLSGPATWIVHSKHLTVLFSIDLEQ